jgi:hypothetical protein
MHEPPDKPRTHVEALGQVPDGSFLVQMCLHDLFSYIQRVGFHMTAGLLLWFIEPRLVIIQVQAGFSGRIVPAA